MRTAVSRGEEPRSRRSSPALSSPLYEHRVDCTTARNRPGRPCEIPVRGHATGPQRPRVADETLLRTGGSPRRCCDWTNPAASDVETTPRQSASPSKRPTTARGIGGLTWLRGESNINDPHMNTADRADRVGPAWLVGSGLLIRRSNTRIIAGAPLDHPRHVQVRAATART